MTYSCTRCGKHYEDSYVADNLLVRVKTVDYDKLDLRGKPERDIPSKTVKGWRCEMCGEAHPTDLKAPGCEE